MLEALAAGLAQLSAAEIVAVLLGFAYLLLAVRRSRWCWAAGAGSCAILVYLSAHKQLPMQALLNLYYVGVSVYGFWHWSREGADAADAVTTLPLRWHLAACAGILAMSVLSARLLARETQSAWPYLDSLTAWASLYATWLVARVKLENWVYWVVIDALLVWLFGVQKAYLVALLNLVNAIVAVFGFATWLKSYRVRLAAQVT